MKPRRRNHSVRSSIGWRFTTAAAVAFLALGWASEVRAQGHVVDLVISGFHPLTNAGGSQFTGTGEVVGPLLAETSNSVFDVTLAPQLTGSNVSPLTGTMKAFIGFNQASGQITTMRFLPGSNIVFNNALFPTGSGIQTGNPITVLFPGVYQENNSDQFDVEDDAGDNDIQLGADGVAYTGDDLLGSNGIVGISIGTNINRQGTPLDVSDDTIGTTQSGQDFLAPGDPRSGMLFNSDGTLDADQIQDFGPDLTPPSYSFGPDGIPDNADDINLLGFGLDDDRIRVAHNAADHEGASLNNSSRPGLYNADGTLDEDQVMDAGDFMATNGFVWFNADGTRNAPSEQIGGLGVNGVGVLTAYSNGPDGLHSDDNTHAQDVGEGIGGGHTATLNPLAVNADDVGAGFAAQEGIIGEPDPYILANTATRTDVDLSVGPANMAWELTVAGTPAVATGLRDVVLDVFPASFAESTLNQNLVISGAINGNLRLEFEAGNNPIYTDPIETDSNNETFEQFAAFDFDSNAVQPIAVGDDIAHDGAAQQRQDAFGSRFDYPGGIVWRTFLGWDGDGDNSPDDQATLAGLSLDTTTANPIFANDLRPAFSGYPHVSFGITADIDLNGADVFDADGLDELDQSGGGGGTFIGASISSHTASTGDNGIPLDGGASFGRLPGPDFVLFTPDDPGVVYNVGGDSLHSDDNAHFASDPNSPHTAGPGGSGNLADNADDSLDFPVVPDLTFKIRVADMDLNGTFEPATDTILTAAVAGADANGYVTVTIPAEALTNNNFRTGATVTSFGPDGVSGGGDDVTHSVPQLFDPGTPLNPFDDIPRPADVIIRANAFEPCNVPNAALNIEGFDCDEAAENLLTDIENALNAAGLRDLGAGIQDIVDADIPGPPVDIDDHGAREDNFRIVLNSNTRAQGHHIDIEPGSVSAELMTMLGFDTGTYPDPDGSGNPDINTQVGEFTWIGTGQPKVESFIDGAGSRKVSAAVLNNDSLTGGTLVDTNASGSVADFDLSLDWNNSLGFVIGTFFFVGFGFDGNFEASFAGEYTPFPGDATPQGSATGIGVDAGDYTTWANNFAGSDGVTTFNTYLEGDWNGDGLTNAADYTVWANNFGLIGVPAGASSAAAVPEPSSLVLLGLGGLGLALVGRRRRNRRLAA